jgi:hypothetical protein
MYPLYVCLSVICLSPCLCRSGIDHDTVEQHGPVLAGLPQRATVADSSSLLVQIRGKL